MNRITKIYKAVGVLVFVVCLGVISTHQAHAAIAYRSYSHGSFSCCTITITEPAGAQQGDLILAMFTEVGYTGEVFTPPSGWTKLSDNGTSALYYIVRGASAPGYNFTYTLGGFGDWAAIDFSGTNGILDDSFVGNFGNNSSSINAPSITINTTGAVMLSGVFNGGNSGPAQAVAPAGFTEPTTDVYEAFGYKLNMSLGATGVSTWTGVQNSTVSDFAWSVAIRPLGSSTVLLKKHSFAFNTSTGTEPTNTVQGDLLVAFVYSSWTSTHTGPAGWTKINSSLYGVSNSCGTGGTGDTQSMWYIVRGASPPNLTWTTNTSATEVTIESISGAAALSSGSTNIDSAVAPSQTTPADGSVLLSFITSSTSPTIPSGMVSEYSNHSAAYDVLAKQYVNKGATGTQTWTSGSTCKAASSVVVSPIVTTTSSNNPTSSSINIISDYAFNNTSNVYLYYSTSNIPCSSMTSNTLVASNQSAGPHSAVTYTLTGLSQGTTYYACSVVYDQVTGLTTYSPATTSNTTIAMPVLTSPTNTSITISSATLGGNVSSDGGSAVTGRGVCIGTSGNPALGGTCISTSGTTGVFTVNATGLSPLTLYHYRAYATNSVGTAYTSDDTFTTLTNQPTGTTTSSPTGVNSYYVTLVGSANPNSYATTGHFRIYSTNPGNCNSDSGGARAPYLYSNDVAVGSDSSPHSFSYQIPLDGSVTFLNPNTTYYYCSFSTNPYVTGYATGTGVGAASTQSFTTPDGPASPCDPPTTGNMTIPAGAVCNFSTLNSGVDAGSGNTNTAAMTVSSGVHLVIGASQRVARGSITLQSGGVLTLAQGATIIKGGIYVHDKDGDGILDDQITYVGSTASAATEFVRRNLLATNYNYAYKLASASATTDCNPSNASVFQTIQTLVKDTDQDGYKTSASAAPQCVGTMSTVNGRTYWKDTSGAYTWLQSGAALGGGATDCQDDPNGAPCTPVSVSASNAASATQNSISYATDSNGGSVPSATSYNLVWCSGSSCSPSTTINGISQPYTHTSLSSNTIYGYQVTATNSHGTSGASSPTSYATTLGAPGAPTSPIASVSNSTKTINLSWTAPGSGGGPTGYYVYWCSGVSCTPVTKIDTGSTAVTYPFTTGVTCGTAYGFAISAYNGGGESAKTSTVTGTPNATNNTCYTDADGDGQRPAGYSSYPICGTTCPANTERTDTTNVDCYDGNANAFVGQTAYFTTNRGDGSYDYDCVGGAVKQQADMCNQDNQISGYYTSPCTGPTSILVCNTTHAVQNPSAACGQQCPANSCQWQAGGFYWTDAACSAQISASYAYWTACH